MQQRAIWQIPGVWQETRGCQSLVLRQTWRLPKTWHAHVPLRFSLLWDDFNIIWGWSIDDDYIPVRCGSCVHRGVQCLSTLTGQGRRAVQGRLGWWYYLDHRKFKLRFKEAYEKCLREQEKYFPNHLRCHITADLMYFLTLSRCQPNGNFDTAQCIEQVISYWRALGTKPIQTPPGHNQQIVLWLENGHRLPRVEMYWGVQCTCIQGVFLHWASPKKVKVGNT